MNKKQLVIMPGIEMRKIFCMAVIFFFFLTSLCIAITVRKNSSIAKSGKYRQSQMRMLPNNTKFNNWSTKGNTNPYTANKGIVNSYKNKLNEKKKWINKN